MVDVTAKDDWRDLLAQHGPDKALEIWMARMNTTQMEQACEDIAAAVADHAEPDGPDRFAHYTAIDAARKKLGKARRSAAGTGYPAVARRASHHGLTLLRHSSVHYQLAWPDGGVLDIYPGNKRLYRAKGRKRAPFLKVPQDWILFDVVDAAINDLAATPDKENA